MSLTVKKAATVLSLATIATAFVVACAAAQMGPGGPTGGTSLRVATEEGHGSLGSIGLASRQFVMPFTWQGAFGSFVATQYVNSFVARTPDTRTLAARRTVVKR